MRGGRRDHESSFPRAAWGVGWGFGGYAKTGLETLFWLDLGRKFCTVESCPLGRFLGSRGGSRAGFGCQAGLAGQWQGRERPSEHRDWALVESRLAAVAGNNYIKQTLIRKYQIILRQLFGSLG